MICFPLSKINLGLQVLSKRTDGFHDIESVFYPVSMRDGLEVVRDLEHEMDQKGGIVFNSSGLEIPGIVESNLVIKAWQLMQREFNLPSIRVHLHKAIPMGAGLGGGSSDAASLIILVNKLFELGLNSLEMRRFAEQIGSDCPFFIESKPMLVSGRGEILEDFAIDLSLYRIELAFPGIHINTKEAYQGVKPCTSRESLRTILMQPITMWKDLLHNDFEDTILPRYPEIEEIKHSFYHRGAIFASMTGSGSAVYGIFR